MLRRLATLPIKDMFVPRYQVPSEPSVMGRGRVYAQVKLSLEMATLMLLFSSFCHKILLFFLPKSHIFAVKVTTKRSITKKDGNIKIKLPLPWYNFLLSRVGSFCVGTSVLRFTSKNRNITYWTWRIEQLKKMGWYI